MIRKRVTLEFVFAVLLSSFVDLCGACDMEDQSLCPPHFPDFLSTFRETLNLIPALNDSLRSLTPQGNNSCPMAVNWTQFNTMLDIGVPIALDPVCLPSSPSPGSRTSVTRSSPYLLSSSLYSDSPGVSVPTREIFSEKGPGSSPSSLTTESQSTLIAESVKSDGPNRNLVVGLAVGITVGVLVLATVAAIAIVLIKNRRQKKNDIFQRVISTTSQSPLVNDEYSQPTTPATPMPNDPMANYSNSLSIKKGMIRLRDSTFQESSTDATLPKIKGLVTVENGVITPDEMETLEKPRPGYDNKGFEAAEYEQDDAGYAGSEVGQEVWENEMNILFESAKMESSEDLAKVRGVRKEGDSSSLVHEEPSQFVVPTASGRPRDLFRQPASTKLSSLKVRLPSPTKPTHSSQPSSTSPPAAPLGPPSPSKPQSFTFNPSHLTKASKSVFDSNSLTKPPISPICASPQELSQSSDFEQGSPKSPSSPNFVPSSPLSAQSLEAPPIYSSPLFREDENRGFFVEKERQHRDKPSPGTPSELPTYSQALALPKSTNESVPSVPQRIPPSSQKQKEPVPQPKPRFQAIAVKPPPFESNGDQKRATKTAVIRPCPVVNADAAQVGAEFKIRMDPTLMESSIIRAPATELPPEDVGYSFKPVRSLRSQFEAAAAASENRSDSISTKKSGKE